MILGALALLMAVPLQAEEKSLRTFITEGSRLPSFELQTLEGQEFASSSLAGKIGVVVFFRPGQPGSLAAFRELRRLKKDLAGISWELIGVVSGQVAAKDVRETVEGTGFWGTVLLDPDRKAYAGFAVVAVPSFAVFDANSKVVYSRAGLPQDLRSKVTHYLYNASGKTPPEKTQSPSLRLAAQVKLARALLERGKVEQAETLLRKILEKERTVEAYLLLGELLLQRKEPRKALTLMQRVAQSHPKDHRLQVGIGRALSALGQVEEAERMLEKLALRAPNSWEVHVALGELYEKLNKNKLANGQYRKAISLLRRRLVKEQRSEP